jgi:hypothetical protein
MNDRYSGESCTFSALLVENSLKKDSLISNQFIGESSAETPAKSIKTKM